MLPRFLATAVGLSLSAQLCHAIISPAQKQALIDFYNGAGGPSWTQTWNLASDPCVAKWFGITCDSIANRNVQGISLAQNGLSGTISPAITNLTSLGVLQLQYNDLSGSIPTALFGSCPLQTVDLSFNRLSGSLPSNIGTPVGVQSSFTLTLDNNQLTGTLPNLSWNWGVVSMKNNKIQGAIPVSLVYSGATDMLDLSYNQLTGTIPDSFSPTEAIYRVNLAGNQLTGTFPSSLAKQMNLQYLDLSNNALNGTLPATFEYSTALKDLNLQLNTFTGGLDNLGNLGNLRTANLSCNQFNGSVPLGLQNLGTLQYLDLHNNQLTGTVPNVLLNMGSLMAADFSHNMLTGFAQPFVLPVTSYSNSYYYFSYNNMAGELPVLQLQPNKIIGLALDHNQFTYSNPNITKAFNACAFEFLDVSENPLGSDAAFLLQCQSYGKNCSNYVSNHYCNATDLTSASPTASVSASVSVTPSITASASVTPSITPSLSVTPSVTASPSITPSVSVSPSLTASPSFSATPSPVASPHHSGMSKGELAGIGAGVGVAVIGAAAGVWFCTKRRRSVEERSLIDYKGF